MSVLLRCAKAAAEGLTDGCNRWAGFKGVLLHLIGLRHFWHEGAG